MHARRKGGGRKSPAEPRGNATRLTQPAPVAQLDRASVYGTEGQRFESSRARCAGRLTKRSLRGQVSPGREYVPNMSQEVVHLSPGGRSRRRWASGICEGRAGMSFASSGAPGRPGTRSTACPTAGRSSARSDRRGPRAGVRRPATTRSGPPRSGCATCSTRRAAARCRARFRPARRSPTRPPSSCATRAMTAALKPVDAARLPLDHRRAPAARVRRPPARGHHDRRDRALARGARLLHARTRSPIARRTASRRCCTASSAAPARSGDCP